MFPLLLSRIAQRLLNKSAVAKKKTFQLKSTLMKIKIKLRSYSDTAKATWIIKIYCFFTTIPPVPSYLLPAYSSGEVTRYDFPDVVLLN